MTRALTDNSVSGVGILMTCGSNQQSVDVFLTPDANCDLSSMKSTRRGSAPALDAGTGAQRHAVAVSVPAEDVRAVSGVPFHAARIGNELFSAIAEAAALFGLNDDMRVAVSAAEESPGAAVFTPTYSLGVMHRRTSSPCVRASDGTRGCRSNCVVRERHRCDEHVRRARDGHCASVHPPTNRNMVVVVRSRERREGL